MKREFYEKLYEILDLNEEAYIVTAISGKVNNYNIQGEKLLISRERMVMRNKELEQFWNEVINDVDFSRDYGVLRLDDKYELFIEHIVGKAKLVICGGGHVSLAISRIAKMLNFDVTIIDDRKDFANRDRFEDVDNIICMNFDEALKEIKYTVNSYFIIVTRGHREDLKCLEAILNNKFKYVGMIGSKTKVASTFSNLMEKGYKKEVIDRIHAPIGLNIGARTPEEIAVAIAGELISVKNHNHYSDIDQDVLNEIIRDCGEKVIVTIIDKRGSAPRGIGANMIIDKSGRQVGTIGGGSVEAAAYKRATEVMSEKVTSVMSYDISNTDASNLGMICGGKIKVLFEYIDGKL